MTDLRFRFGTGNEVTRNDLIGQRLATALGDARLRTALAYGASVEGNIQGQPQSPDLILRQGMVVDIHDKACSKQS